VAQWPWEKLVFYSECLSEAQPEQPQSLDELPNMDDIEMPSTDELPAKYRP
jgi:hypothetical protein